MCIRDRAWRSALKYLAFCVTTGDISLFTWIAVVSMKLGVEKALLSDFSVLETANIDAGSIATFLLIIGFITKMALVPLHFWLPDAYSVAPPAAAALMSGVMEKMGLYGILRVYSLISLDTHVFTALLISLGFLTTVYASLMAAAQTDMRRLLAYSTIMHCGLLAMLAGLATMSKFAWSILMLYVIFHGVSKAQLFLNVGSVYLLTNTTDVHELGYLAKTDPELYSATILGASSLMGLPPTLGFAVKALLIYVAFDIMNVGGMYPLLFLLAVAISSVFGVVYVVKYIGAYVGSLREPSRPTIRLPKRQILAEQLLGWSAVALVPLMLVVSLNLFMVLLMAIYLVSVVLLFCSLYIKAPRTASLDDVWLGGITP